jgi:hypothetical protein
MPAAIQAGLVLHAVETAAGLAYGMASALALLADLRSGSLLKGSRALLSMLARAAPAGRVQPEATKP